MFVPKCLPSACHKSGVLWESLASLRAIYLIDLEPCKLQQTQDKALVSKSRPAYTPHSLLKGESESPVSFGKPNGTYTSHTPLNISRGAPPLSRVARNDVCMRNVCRNPFVTTERHLKQDLEPRVWLLRVSGECLSALKCLTEFTGWEDTAFLRRESERTFFFPSKRGHWPFTSPRDLPWG